MKPVSFLIQTVLVFFLVPCWTSAQFSSGSDGRDGALKPNNMNYVIDMADHPDGVYQYTSVDIPAGYTVRFKPNRNNTPIVWLVQGTVLINGSIDLRGEYISNTSQGALGGVGGFRGGTGRNGDNSASVGQGPGGGTPESDTSAAAGNASFGSSGGSKLIYGNIFLLPLVGGSGGAGSSNAPPPRLEGAGGGGGGGAILIAANQTLTLNGGIDVSGGWSSVIYEGNGGICCAGGGGSGGAVRLAAPQINGSGSIMATGGFGNAGRADRIPAGSGRIRFDTLESTFSGHIEGVFTKGFQPILFPNSNEASQLSIISVAAAPVPAAPTGALLNPDALIGPKQANPIPVVIRCQNLALNTAITVNVKPANGLTISAVGYNKEGTATESTATILVNMPRGGGILWATAITEP
jgi:hypothetical protein